MKKVVAIFLLTALPLFCQAFEPFTGKIAGEKVRLRLQPHLEGPVLRQLDPDQMLVVIGETEDFYAVKPPNDIKAYIFRTFVFDNTVEGSHVNVRLGPTLEAPVLCQLNVGDKVEGGICNTNNKWLEITPPEAIRFFVYKDYIKNVGDQNLLSSLEKRRQEVNHLLNVTYDLSQEEMLKSFEEINLDIIVENIERVMHDYTDFSDQVKRAKTLLTLVQQNYLELKAVYLESKAQQESVLPPETVCVVEEEPPPPPPVFEEPVVVEIITMEKPKVYSDEHLKMWEPVERELFTRWTKKHGPTTFEDYYSIQKESAKQLTGIVKLFESQAKNKPGNFLLIDPDSEMPLAYLYSTGVNLEELLEQEIHVQASSRPDHHFALPAYYVLSVE